MYNYIELRPTRISDYYSLSFVGSWKRLGQFPTKWSVDRRSLRATGAKNRRAVCPFISCSESVNSWTNATQSPMVLAATLKQALIDMASLKYSAFEEKSNCLVLPAKRVKDRWNTLSDRYCLIHKNCQCPTPPFLYFPHPRVQIK